MINVLKQKNNIIDANNIMTIPKNNSKFTLEVDFDSSNNPNTWTFYTNLDKVNDITITFETNEGSNIEQLIIPINTKPTRPQNPVKDGFTFAGWYLNKELTTPYYFNQTLSNDTTLYAKWGEIKITVVDIEEHKNIQTVATDTKILLLTITMVAASILLLIRRK